MSLLIDANISCNLDCEYCYNKNLRNNIEDECILNLDKIEKQLERCSEKNLSSNVTLHGGENFILPNNVLEELLQICNKYFDTVNIQTNGTKLDDEEKIKIVEEYVSSLGISVDGPDDLNRFRADKQTTKNIIENTKRLKEESDIEIGLLSIISRANGLPEHRNKMKKFIKELDEYDINGRMNPCYHPSYDIMLYPNELKNFYLDIFEFNRRNGIYGWTPFNDFINAVKGNKNGVVCTFGSCDPYTTMGGIIITHDGRLSQCAKFSDSYLSNDLENTNTRNKILSKTDCKGCEYWDYCHGGCPQYGRNNDWRNKTIFCSVWKSLLDKITSECKFYNIKQNKNEENKCENEVDNKGHGDHYEHIENV